MAIVAGATVVGVLATVGVVAWASRQECPQNVTPAADLLPGAWEADGTIRLAVEIRSGPCQTNYGLIDPARLSYSITSSSPSGGPVTTVFEGPAGTQANADGTQVAVGFVDATVPNALSSGDSVTVRVTPANSTVARGGGLNVFVETSFITRAQLP